MTLRFLALALVLALAHALASVSREQLLQSKEDKNTWNNFKRVLSKANGCRLQVDFTPPGPGNIYTSSSSILSQIEDAQRLTTHNLTLYNNPNLIYNVLYWC